MNKSHCVIRGKSTVPSDIFGKAIANLGFECHHVTKNEAGDEVSDMKLYDRIRVIEFIGIMLSYPKR
jgi:hypothetical protein